ncbi:MFS transporter [Sediminispirochaeta smaragdinae]|jgi:MFS family permease|nr:MFS transporter [Sediminispirochaeta smaragdinae]
MDKMMRLNLLHILNDGFLASLPLLLPFIQKDLGIEFSKIGLLTGLLNSASVILALPAASIAMRFGGYKVLLMSMVLYSCAFIITGLSSGFMLLTCAFILASIGFGLFHPISFALIANSSDQNDIGNRMGSFTAMGDIGRVGIAACVTIFVSIVDWRNTAFMYGVLPLVMAILSLIFLYKVDFSSSLAEKAKIRKIHGLHKSKEFIIAILTSFIDSLASSSLFVFLPFLFVYRGASTAILGSLSGAFFIGNMMGKIMIGKITDRIGCKKVFIISEILMSLLLISISIVKDIIMISIVSIMLGTVTKGTVPIINTLIAKAVPDRKLNEKAFSIVSFVSGISAVIAPLLLGFLAQKYNIIFVFHISALFAFIAVLPILITTLFFKKHTCISA